MSGKLILTGVQGSLLGQKFSILEGESVIVGRSRRCDIVLDSANTNDFSILQTDLPYQTISRQHLKITFHNEMKVELEDLSANGTWVDNERMEHLYITDITTEKHSILLGNREKFILEWEEE